MCDVMERAVNKGKEEVREEERINSIKVLIASLEEFGISSEAIIEKVMEKFNFSRDEAEASERALFSCEKESYAVIVYSNIYGRVNSYDKQ